MSARWEGDERGLGVGDGRSLLGGASELLDALSAEGWVAEQPERHLLPHLEQACADGAPLSLTGTGTNDDGTFCVDLRWRGAPGDVRAARAAVYALVGSIAETASYIRQRRPSERADIDAPDGDDVLVYEVATGMLAPDTGFAPHGHTLRLRVAGVFRHGL